MWGPYGLSLTRKISEQRPLIAWTSTAAIDPVRDDPVEIGRIFTKYSRSG